MNSNKLKVKLSTYKSELAFEISSRLLAKDLYSQVCKHLGVHEYWYFGLNYLDSENDEIWIDTSRKNVRKYDNILQLLHFHAKYMPVDVSDLIEDITVNLFYLQVRAGILHGKIYCPAETCALLASYSCQVRHGDYKDNTTIPENERLIPDTIASSHAMEPAAWRAQIIGLWKKHNGTAREDAQLEYLRIAQDLDTYGLHFFPITNKKGSNLLLGIHARGLNIYQEEDKINPKIMFPWGEIRSLSFHGKRFTIKVQDKGAQDFIFTCSLPKLCKRILTLGIGYHSMYVERQRDSRAEIPQLRATAEQRKAARREQREKLLAEVRLREAAERERQAQQEQIIRLQRQVEESAAQLAAAQRTITNLHKQLAELQAAKEELEHQRSELQDMMRKLEQSIDMEVAEREQLRAEVAAKQEEVARMTEDIEGRDAEARRLQQLVEEAQAAQEELRQKQLVEEAAAAEASRIQAAQEEERRIREEEELAAAALAAANSEAADGQLADVNKKLQDQLRQLQTQLESSRIVANESTEDRLYRENLAKGNDKYKTLRNIRQGNTGRRIDSFENM